MANLKQTYFEAAASTTVNDRKEMKKEKSSPSILRVIELGNISVVVVPTARLRTGSKHSLLVSQFKVRGCITEAIYRDSDQSDGSWQEA